MSIRRISDAEWATRVNLAAAYRLAALNGWDDTIYTHISAALPDEPGVYLINPYGLLFEEVCASNLVKVNTRGQKLDDSPHSVNPTGFAIHGAIHGARPDARCVLHLHTAWGMALSMVPGGLLPTTQHAMRLFQRLGRHAYEGLALGEAEGARLLNNLGDRDGLILENHGTLTVGHTVAEAYMLMHHLERAARAQLQAMAATGGKVIVPTDAVAAHTYRQWIGDGSERDGDAEWPALLRRLDRLDSSYKK
jgi:ribulose-5-phosphate 4-epimerase/fuculose-1-phosphate aldolase